MIRFWGQAKFTASDGKLAGYELFLRERSQRDGEWYLPSDFGQFKVSALDDLLGATFAGMPSDLLLVSLNLDEEQFADPEYYTQLGVCQRKGGPRLIVELTERLGTGANTVTHEALVDAAKAYQELGIQVCIDDVGTGANLPELVDALDPYVDEYKYALQNVRGTLTLEEVRVQVAYWAGRAQQAGHFFALEGIETPADLPLVREFQPQIVQGYYFGRPHPLTIAADFDL